MRGRLIIHTHAKPQLLLRHLRDDHRESANKETKSFSRYLGKARVATPAEPAIRNYIHHAALPRSPCVPLVGLGV